MTSLRRLACATSALALFAAVACSNSSPAVPQAYITATVSPGNHPSNVCPVLASVSGWVTLGTPQASVADGNTQNGATAGVSCTVTSNPDGSFNVTGNVSLTGDNGGSVFISGKFQPPPATVQQVTGKFQRGDTGGGKAFAETDCTVTFSGNQGVAAGRVWGNLNCPNIVNMETMVVGPPGGFWTCAGTAEFKFENCAE
jgi:hypothetical protein